MLEWRALLRPPFVGKRKIKIMEKLKLVLGFLLLPVAFVIFVCDRMIYTIMPQEDHKKFNEWLNNSNVLFATIRIVMIFVLRWIFYWIFKI